MGIHFPKELFPAEMGKIEKDHNEKTSVPLTGKTGLKGNFNILVLLLLHAFQVCK